MRVMQDFGQTDDVAYLSFEMKIVHILINGNAKGIVFVPIIELIIIDLIFLSDALVLD